MNVERVKQGLESLVVSFGHLVGGKSVLILLLVLVGFVFLVGTYNVLFDFIGRHADRAVVRLMHTALLLAVMGHETPHRKCSTLQVLVVTLEQTWMERTRVSPTIELKPTTTFDFLPITRVVNRLKAWTLVCL